MRLSATYRHRFAYGGETYWPTSISLEIADTRSRGCIVTRAERWKEGNVSKFRVDLIGTHNNEFSILFRVFR